MSGNTFGHLFRLTTFGESHGIAIGGVIDGCPSGLIIDMEFIQKELDRRRPHSSVFGSSRTENDRIEIISGIFKGKTTGSPIAFLVRNEDTRPEDYDFLQDTFRPSHADYTYEKKYGFRDHRGGGRASARETVARVIAGSIARQFLNVEGIRILAYVSQIGPFVLTNSKRNPKISEIESSPVRCPDETLTNKMIKYLEELKEKGDSAGGVITCLITGIPIGLGEPVFDKLHADLGKAMLSINAAKGFEIGSGFKGAAMKGSDHNDPIHINKEKSEISTGSNFSGGVQGGISNGEIINFRVAFKPVASINIPQNTINKDGKQIKLKIEGRHDVCIVPRVVPIIEAMAAIVIIDHFLRNKVYQNK
ncbi:chorismate synthase [candidate division KSB1 bacterium]